MRTYTLAAPRMRLRQTLLALVLLAATRPYEALGQTMPQHDSTSARSPAPASTSVTVTVAGKPLTFTPADLAAMPQKSVSVHNEHTGKDETYTGVLLSAVLAKAGFTPSSVNHREMLQSYLSAQGTDHYGVLYSVVEVEPTEHRGDVLIATGVDGHSLDGDGNLKLVSSEDTKPQRWVRNLTAITLKSAE